MEPEKIRGIYLLPNLFTTCALFAGFYAIIAANDGRFHEAAVAILIAMILDGVDGRVARLTNTQSEFGAEYDSFSDLVAFGIAPALVLYHWSLIHINDIGPGWAKPGWIAAFFFIAMAAMRLARFNVKTEEAGNKYFYGVPSPTAAALVTGFLWINFDNGVSGESVRWLAFLIIMSAGALMMSDIRYYSFKDIDFMRKVPAFWMPAVVLFLVLLVLNPPAVLFIGALVYTASGPLYTLYRRGRSRNTD